MFPWVQAYVSAQRQLRLGISRSHGIAAYLGWLGVSFHRYLRCGLVLILHWCQYLQEVVYCSDKPTGGNEDASASVLRFLRGAMLA
jgi:hypothetical protein